MPNRLFTEPLRPWLQSVGIITPKLAPRPGTKRGLGATVLMRPVEAIFCTFGLQLAQNLNLPGFSEHPHHPMFTCLWQEMLTVDLDYTRFGHSLVHGNGIPQARASYRTCLRPTFCPHDAEHDAWKNIHREIGTCGSRHRRLALQCKRRFRFFFYYRQWKQRRACHPFQPHFFQRRLKWQRLCGAAPIDDVRILVFMRHSHIAEESLSFVRPVMNRVVLADHRVI